MIAPWEQSRWLVLSSCFFLIPAVYTFINELYTHTGVLVCTTTISINFWRKPTYSWRRTMDLIYAKLLCLYFLFYLGYVKKPYIIIIYPSIGIIGGCYYLSNTLWAANNSTWVVFHMLFHLITVVVQLIIIII